MIWPKFSIKVLQITIVHINEWDNIQNKAYLWNRIYICKIKYIWYQSNTSERKKEEF